MSVSTRLPFRSLWACRRAERVGVADHGQYVLSPLPNYFVVAENLATFHSLGIRGWFSESVCCHPREEMVELKVFLWGRLAFDPTLNATTLTEEFLDGFYSKPAAPHVMRYLRLLDASMRERGLARPGKPRPFKTNSPEKREEDKWSGGPFSAMFDNATVLDAAASLTAAAKAAAPGSKYRLRVSQAMIAVQFVAFYRWAELQAYAEASGKPWPLSPSISKEFDRFAAAMNVSGLKGNPITSVVAALAPNGTANAGGEVSVAQFREQVVQAQVRARPSWKSDDGSHGKASAGCRHERLLPNGICLPDLWPPIVNVTTQYRTPPYLDDDCPAGGLGCRPEVIEISGARQLLVDDFLVEGSVNLSRTFHRAEVRPEPVLWPTEPWESESANPSIARSGHPPMPRTHSAMPFTGGAWFDPRDGVPVGERYKLFCKCTSQ